MKSSYKSRSELKQLLVDRVWVLLCVVLTLACVAGGQQGKGAADETSVTGHYEGNATNKAGDVITVSMDLTEKAGALSGTIRSSHGDFPITGGSHQGETVTIEFEAGTAGTISVRVSADRLVGTWTAGDDGGPVDVKKGAAPEGGTKGKS